METPDGLRNRPAHSVYPGVEDDDHEESVEALRERLKQMKAIVSEKEDKRKKSGLDESFLSVVFACILLVIAGVSVYAFVVLYAAVSRRWTEQLEE